MVLLNLSLAGENNLSLHKFFGSLSEKEMPGQIRKSLSCFFRQAINEDVAQQACACVDQWRKQGLTALPKEAVKVADVVLFFSIRKQLFLFFLPQYTQDVNLFSKIVSELEVFHRKKEQYAFETFSNVQQEELLAGTEELAARQKEVFEAGEKLKEQQYFISAVMESVPEMIFIYDIIEDKNVYSNNEIIRVLGYTPEEFKAFGKGLLKSHTHPEDLHLVKERNRQYLNMKEGDVADVTFRYRNSQGVYRSIRTKSRIYKFTPDGKPWQVLGVTEDVTEKVRQEEELNNSRDYYLTILDDFPSLIWRSNKEGLCDYFNKSWLEFTGRTFEQEFGNGWTEGVHPDDFDRCLEVYQTNFKARQSFQMEYRMKRYDRTYRWIVDYGKPLLNVGGEFTGFLGACFDIQERKDFEEEIQRKNRELSATLDELQRAQEQLIESNSTLELRVTERTAQLEAGEQQLRLLTDALPTCISFVDCNLFYKFVNKTYSIWFGKTKEEIEGQHCKEIIGEAAFKKAEPFLLEALSGREVKMEGVMDYKYGGSRTVSSSFIPFFENGQVKGLYALIYDISEIRKAQQSLEVALSDITKKNTELTRINNDLDNFIYAASHDLKSPVINMEGILNLLEKTLLPKLDQKEEQLFKLMDASVYKLKTTISYLTDVTRVSKNIEEAKEVISVSAIVEEVRNNNQHLTDLVSPEIREEYEIETIEFVRGNFYSIVLNLFTNAVKFHSPERPLKIGISTFTEGDFVVLEVKDNGLGLSLEKQQNAFKLFKRMHSHIEGSGVGLYIVKRIAENCGGKVTVEGAEGEGAVFKVYLPASFSNC